MSWGGLAAVLAFAIGSSHSLLGERYVIRRLLRRDLPKLFGSDRFTKQTLRFAWHVTTVAWWGLGLLSWQLGKAEGPLRETALAIIAATFLVTAAIALVGSKGRHLSWIVFLAIAAASWLAR